MVRVKEKIEISDFFMMLNWQVEGESIEDTLDALTGSKRVCEDLKSVWYKTAKLAVLVSKVD